jgi:S-adenosylmethionine:tRNA ribosyltransferase-isomerase
MVNPKNINIKDFTYNLPDEKIAKFPLPERQKSKLLVYKDGTIYDTIFEKITDFLPENSTLVLNNTKVIQARILLQLDDAKPVELFLLDSAEGLEIAQAMMKKKEALWNCLVGNSKKFKHAYYDLSLEFGKVRIYKPVKYGEKFQVKLEWEADVHFSDIIEQIGKTPLPPYIKRESNEEDKIKYQTVFASVPGSVAAPTAGLHFTPDILENVKKKQITKVFVSLHVGAGTFKPVKAHQLAEHVMHHEEICVDLNALQKLKKANFITSVGTTSLRTLETLYWIGVKINNKFPIHPFELVSQWEPYELLERATINFSESIEQIIEWMRRENMNELKGRTSLMIAPGYPIKSANALITNFHQPESSLLLLVAAIIGDYWRMVYNHALNSDYRFLSYGDASLLFRSTI